MENDELELALDKSYCNDDNYMICRKKGLFNQGICYIYCSSNGLYKKGNLADFKNKVITQNRYEWMNLRPEIKPELEIFIRDIYLSWYVKGINNIMNTYEKLIEFLKKKTVGYKTFCVGVSSGGFIGNILAMELDAEFCYCFNGQFSLRNHFDHISTNSYLRDHINNDGDYWLEYYKRFFSLNSSFKIIYILANKSEQDYTQYCLVKDSRNIVTIEIDSKEHGVGIYQFAIHRFLNYSFSDCECLSKKVQGKSKLFASLQIAGIWKCIYYVGRKYLSINRRNY